MVNQIIKLLSQNKITEFDIYQLEWDMEMSDFVQVEIEIGGEQ